MRNVVIIVASFTRESRKRIICDYIMREMICSQVISYGTSILQLTKWDWVCFYLSPYIPILKEKGTAYFFFSLREVLDWFLALESESNDPEYHEHDCMMAYFHMLHWISCCVRWYWSVSKNWIEKSPGLKHGISKHY